MRGRGLLSLGILAAAVSPVFAGPGVEVGSKAPDVSAPAWLNLPKGMKKVTSSDFRGKVLMIEFWATW
jgi:hypothetical protein